MRFEDLHDYSSETSYSVPNEEPLVWRSMLTGSYVRRAAGICSAGEVGMFGVLPSVRGELILIDHSYRSLGIAMMKYLLLRERGWKDTVRLITKVEANDELVATVQDLQRELPAKIKDDNATAVFGSIMNTYKYQFVGYNTAHPGLVRMWEYMPKSLIKTAERKLEKITFIHGDITDLVERGPFDLLYLSNALEHTGRNRTSPNVDLLQKVVKPGGRVASCQHTRANKVWKNVLTKRGTKSSWTYTLYETPSS